MKKKLSVMTVIILALAICVSAWFYGYYNRKSNDNLPTLTAIAEMSEADVNSLLPGYHIDQLREVWGKPGHNNGLTGICPAQIRLHTAVLLFGHDAQKLTLFL